MRTIIEVCALAWALCEARALLRFATNFAAAFYREAAGEVRDGWCALRDRDRTHLPDRQLIGDRELAFVDKGHRS